VSDTKAATTKPRLTGAQRLVLARLAMPEGQIEEIRQSETGGNTSRYEMSWREDGILYGASVTERMVRNLLAFGLIEEETQERRGKAGEWMPPESIFTTARRPAPL